MPAKVRSLVVCGCLSLATLLGCGKSGPELADVVGTVTLNGEPLQGALVMFEPQFGNGSPSYGACDDQGRYEMKFTQSKNGAMVGKHTVRITTENENERVRERVPKEFNENSTLTREVESGVVNTIDIALETE